MARGDVILIGFYSLKNVFRGQAIMGEGLRGVIGD